jgi:hypothetical protein
MAIGGEAPEDAAIAEIRRLHSNRRDGLIRADPAGAWNNDRPLCLMAEYQRAMEHVQSTMQPLREELQQFWQGAIARTFGPANQVRIQWQAMSRQDRAEVLRLNCSSMPEKAPRHDPSVLFLLPEINIEDLTCGDSLLDLIDERLGNTASAHAQDRTWLASWHERQGLDAINLCVAAVNREVFLLNIITCFLGPMCALVLQLRENMLAGRSEAQLQQTLTAQARGGGGPGLIGSGAFDNMKAWSRLNKHLMGAWQDAAKTAKKLNWSETTRRLDLMEGPDGRAGWLGELPGNFSFSCDLKLFQIACVCVVLLVFCSKDVPGYGQLFGTFIAWLMLPPSHMGSALVVILLCAKLRAPFWAWSGAAPKPVSSVVRAGLVDCVESAWSEWDSCTETCGGGLELSHRSVLVEMQQSGRPCGASSRTRACNTDPCPTNWIIVVVSIGVCILARLWWTSAKPPTEGRGAGLAEGQLGASDDAGWLPGSTAGTAASRRRGRGRQRRNTGNRTQQQPQPQPNHGVQQQQPPALPAAPLSQPFLGKPGATEPSWWEDLADYHCILYKEAPSTYTCSISLEIMRDPWMLVETTNNFEAKAIYKWVVTQGKTVDPKTQEPLTSPDLKPNVALRRDIRNWCEERVAELAEHNAALQPAPADHTAPKSLHVFVDDSNLCRGRKSGEFTIGQLASRIHGIRALKQQFVVGSGSKPDHWKRWREAGYKVHTDPRSGPERFVDEALMSQIAKAASLKFPQPRVLAVVTGDGNSNEGRATFPEHIETALLSGWFVELYAWKGTVNRTYTGFARAYPKKFRLIHLDDLLRPRPL